MNDKKEFVTRQYFCRICKSDHYVRLRKENIKNREKYPFSHIFLHGDLKNILTILYIDSDAQIRGVDVQELTDDDIFSKEHVMSITKKLISEIERIREENDVLHQEIQTLKKSKLI